MKLLSLLTLLVVIISCKQTETQLTKIVAKNIAIDSTIVASATIDSIVSPYKKQLIVKMDEVLSYSTKKLIKTDEHMQSSLGNLVADMCFEMAQPVYLEKTKQSIDFVLLNHGGIRASIPAGEITKGHAFKLMPFENELVVVTLTGEKISELINYFITNKKAHPLSKNIELIIKENQYDLKINKKTFDKNKNYNVLTSDYLQGGGDRMDFFKNPQKLTKLDYKLRGAIIDYFKKTDTLKVHIDNRVTIK